MSVTYLGEAREPEMIETLERWLKLAKEGRLIGIVAIAEEPDSLHWLWSKWDMATAVGHCHVIIHRLMHRWLDP